ncbi:hypothetical protein EV356DRAFT_518931 [Viridothelium virens]|uniref:Uncharacterized protein n=1 Tax=Viridothelium virens TaxID=1048519 RepID=A0A6A6HJS0_VIRVR|nr:hypothetical protein EV356DRAFT_518931 [Viridothelium virens]
MSKQLAQQSDSKDDFMLKLNKRVKGDEKDLMDLLAGKKSEVAENDRSFISRLQNLPAATIGSVSPTSSTPSLQDPSYHSQSSQVITDSATLFQHCDDLLASYNSTAQAIATASPQTPTQTSDVEVQQGWQQDREKVERLLELGKRVTGRRVEGLVRGKTVEELVRDAERDVEEMEADALFTRAEAEEEVGEEGRGPGEVLRGIEKGAKRMVRGLSKERG